MPLGSRMLRRGRILLSASAGPYSTPRDPLLFLYPAIWNRTTATAQARPAIDTGNEQDAHALRRPLYLAAKDLHSVGSPDRLPESSSGKKDVQDDCDFSPSTKCTHLENDAEQGPNATNGGLSGLPHTMSSTSTGNEGDGLVRRVVRGTFRGRDADGSLVPMPRELKQAIFERKSRRATAGEIRGSFARRVLSQLDKRHAQDVYDASVRQSFQDWTRKERDLPLADWRNILRYLKLQTPRQSTDWHDDVLRILVPLRFVKKLFFNSSGTLWIIKAQHVCKIKLTEETAENSGYRVILLSGPAISIKKAATEILQLAPGSISDEHLLPTPPHRLVTWSPTTDICQSPKTSGSPLIRSVPVHRFHKMAAPIRADMVIRPSRWTSLSFATYVEHLTAIKMSSHVHKLLYNPGETHQDIVMEILRSIFLDHECEGAISVSALNDAITYLLEHSFHSIVRMLYLHMDRIGLKMNTETYNIMLRNAAKGQNLYWFQSVLRMLTGSGCIPNANTWVAFLMALETSQIKLHVIAEMKEKHLFHNLYVRKAVCEQLVSHEVQVTLEKETSQDEFLEHMGSRYGQGWLTMSSANQILDSLGSRGLISRCWEFMNFMRAEGISPDEISIASILHHCEKQANYDGAMEIIRRICSINAFVPSEAIYNCLFNMAWKGKLYATARVTWAYACLDAATSFLMRRRVRRSASTAFAYPTVISSPIGTSTAGNIWQSTAGPFILGQTFLSSLKLSSLLELKQDLQEARENLGEDETLSAQTHAALIAGQEILIEGHSSLLRSQDLTTEDQIHYPDLGDYVSDVQLQYRLPSTPSQPFPFYNDRSEAPPIASSRAPGAESTNRLIVGVIREYIEISREWIPKRPFPELLLEAWEIDKEWKTHGGMKVKSPGAHLQWLSVMAPKILLTRKRRDGHVSLRHWDSGKASG